MLTSITDYKEWVRLCNGKLLKQSNRPIQRIAIDSRENCENAIFVALPGTRTDGHAHLTSAIEKGASALLISAPPPPTSKDLTIIQVPNTVDALQQAAKQWKAMVSPVCIAITGSVGKTTTKEMLFSILQNVAPTFATKENYNTEIGVPLSVLSMPQGTRFFICEFGMRAKGEIAFLSKLMSPDLGILTCIGSSHLEMLGSRNAIAEAKMELISGMQGGTLVYDGEEPLLLPLRTWSGRGVPVYRSQICKLGMRDGNTRFSYQGACYTVQGVGAHLLYDSALACTAARLLGLNEKDVRQGLQSFQPACGRQQIMHLRHNITLIADHYNAAPESMEAAIQSMIELAPARTIAVLGGMLELGECSQIYHEALGRVIAARRISLLWCIGEEAAFIAKGALAGGLDNKQLHLVKKTFEADCLAEEICSVLKPNDTILIKASRKFCFEKLIDAIAERLAE